MIQSLKSCKQKTTNVAQIYLALLTICGHIEMWYFFVSYPAKFKSDPHVMQHFTALLVLVRL